MKIVINDCYGGFGLSEAAYKELGVAWDGFGYGWSDAEKRADQRLVAVVEKLGSEAASGRLAQLKIVNIPRGVEWEIEEYDGIETVREKSRTWR